MVCCNGGVCRAWGDGKSWFSLRRGSGIFAELLGEGSFRARLKRMSWNRGVGKTDKGTGL